MKNSIEAWKARYTLERYLGRLYRATCRKPERFWIQEIREALGLRSCELAKRMGISPSSLGGLVKSERKGVIRLDKLHQAAEAMGCKLVYAFVPPRGSLDGVLNRWKREEEKAALRARGITPEDEAMAFVAAFIRATQPREKRVEEPHALSNLERLREEGKVVE